MYYTLKAKNTVNGAEKLDFIYLCAIFLKTRVKGLKPM